MALSPYLHFDGTCAEALRFYADVFGDPAPELMTYDTVPDAPADWASSRILHGQVKIADGMLLASDSPPGEPVEPQAGMSICASLPSADGAKAAFERLAEGGAIIMPFGETFFSPAFGMVKDRFGTHWMVMLDAPLPD
jgi:PhnB protein